MGGIGSKFNEIRNKIKSCDLSNECKVCKNNIENGNFPLARAYDTEYEIARYPSTMELELSNVCNFECKMCNGYLSSLIRKNRDKLPPLDIPYNDNFVEQLEEFIPHLKELRFNGGEPFLHKLVYKVFDKVRAINPAIKITMATNGSVLNNKVKRALEDLNIHINLSLDSLDKETYENIRVNAKYERVLENLEYFVKYCKTNNRTFCLMVNPMRLNWWEMSDFVDFCNKRKIFLWYNTVHKPEHMAIWNLPKNELRNIYEQLSAKKIKKEFILDPSYKYVYDNNIGNFHQLVEGQIKTWWQQQKQEVLKLL